MKRPLLKPDARPCKIIFTPLIRNTNYYKILYERSSLVYKTLTDTKYNNNNYFISKRGVLTCVHMWESVSVENTKKELNKCLDLITTLQLYLYYSNFHVSLHRSNILFILGIQFLIHAFMSWPVFSKCIVYIIISFILIDWILSFSIWLFYCFVYSPNTNVFCFLVQLKSKIYRILTIFPKR